MFVSQEANKHMPSLILICSIYFMFIILPRITLER
jgi:hypothetical protein